MAANPSSDIETKALLEAIRNVNSNRTSKQLGLITDTQQNVESLRTNLLKGFKAVHDIHDATKQDKKSLRKSITSLFNSSHPNRTIQQAAAIQEAFAYMHRELTNVLAATGNDRKNLDDAVLDQRMAEIIKKGIEKLPKGTLHNDLKIHVDIFQDKAKECLKSQIPTHRQHNR